MATNNDFGLHVALHVKKSNPLLAKEVQDALDNTNRKFHVDIKKVGVTNTVLGETQMRIQNYFDKHKFNLQIQRIDAKAAIETVRQELAQMLEAFRIDNGVNIKGLGSFTDGAYEAAYQRRAATAQRAADATRDEANAEQQLIEEAEATNRELTQRDRLVTNIDRTMRNLSTLRINNPEFTGGVSESGQTYVEKTAEALRNLRAEVISENAANAEAMEQHRQRYAAVAEQVAAYNLQISESKRIEMGAGINLEPLLDKLNSLSAQSVKLGDINEFTAQINNMVERVSTLQNEISAFERTGNGNFIELRSSAESLKQEIDELSISLGRAIKANNLDFTGLTGKLETAKTRANSLDDGSSYISRLNEIQVDIQSLQRETQSFTDLSEKDLQILLQRYANLDNEIKKVVIDIGVAKRTSSGFSDDSVVWQTNFLSKIDTKIQSVEKFLSGNSKVAQSPYESQLSQYISQLEALKDAINSCNNVTQEFKTSSTDAYSTINNNITAAKTQIVKLGLTGNTLLTRFKNGIEKFGGWTIITRALTAVIRLTKQAITNVKEIDSAMTQLKIVTSASSGEMEKFGDKAYAAAKKIGASVTDIVDSATTYARLGYTLDQSADLARYTAMLQKVGDIDVNDAQSAVTAITKAYSDIDVNKIETVMDKMVSVGNNFAISTSEIAEGLNNAASALAASGNTFEQSVALLTAANTTVQDISKASTGLRTITARLRNTTTDLEELGEEMTESKYAELISALTKRGVAIKNAAGEYRSTYDIMADLTSKWSELTSMEQSALATAIAGTRQQNVFYGLISNFSEASGAMDSMSKSAGTLSKTYETYLDSIEGRTEQLKATFQEFSNSVMNSDLVKTGASFVTSIVGALTKLNEGIGITGNKINLLIPIIASLGMTIASIKNKNFGRNKMLFQIKYGEEPKVSAFYMDTYSFAFTRVEIQYGKRALPLFVRTICKSNPYKQSLNMRGTRYNESIMRLYDYSPIPATA